MEIIELWNNIKIWRRKCDESFTWTDVFGTEKEEMTAKCDPCNLKILGLNNQFYKKLNLELKNKAGGLFVACFANI